jgi:adenylate kinase
MNAQKDTRPFNLILLGDPASGKGTQSARLAKKYGMYDLDMGKEVRKPAVAKLFDYAHTTAVGKLTPTKVVHSIFTRTILHTPAHRGIVFSGTPKMIGEAKLVARLLKKTGRRDPLFLYITVPFAEALRRIGGRREYRNGKLLKRDDDNIRALRNRSRYYREQVSQVVKFFGARYEYKRISGFGSRRQVGARIDAAVAAHLKKHKGDAKR